MPKHFSQIVSVMKLLTSSERRKLLFVITIAMVMAAIEVVGVGSVMPFMSVASKPEIIHTQPILKKIYDIFNFNNDLSFVLFLGVSVLFFLILTNITQAFMHYIKVKFTSMRRHTMSLRLLSIYMGQDYVFFLNRNSHELIKNINSEIQQMISGTLMQFVDLLSRLIQVLLLTAFLFFVDPISTLGISGAILLIYGTIYLFIKNILKKLGVQRFELFSLRTKVVSEAFWGIKEVKITGTENVFIKEYIKPSRQMAINESINEIIGDVPKFALETVAFSSIMIFVLMTILKSGTFADVAGTVTLYAYAGYRMIPAVQGVFKALTKLRYGAPTAERLINEFKLNMLLDLNEVNKAPRISCREHIILDKISFSYPNMDKHVLDDISMHIRANSLIGIIGTTGSGKTTLIDIILGLLCPSSGKIYVDGIELDSFNIRGWQSSLGYVPQSIYLSDTTIAENIAFGVPKKNIDMDKVRRAACMAQISHFIENDLLNQYQTTVGERGVRLSGGQRQRLGIARALYRDPSVLIMDEATSALDNQTEKAVMEAIDELQGTRTIILIAHRLTTLNKCDSIFHIEKGKLIGVTSPLIDGSSAK